MEKNEYKLTISIEDGITGENPISNQGQSQNENLSTQKALSLMTAYNVAQPFINKTMSIIQNNVDTKLGSQELSSRINLQMQIAEFGTRTLVGVASGRSLASMLGLGTNFGGIIGGLVMVGGFAMNIMAKQNEINNKAYIENEQINVLKGRAGIQFNRSRSGE